MALGCEPFNPSVLVLFSAICCFLFLECCEDCRLARLQEQSKEEGEFYYAPIYVRRLTQDDASQEVFSENDDIRSLSDEEGDKKQFYSVKQVSCHYMKKGCP